MKHQLTETKNKVRLAELEQDKLKKYSHLSLSLSISIIDSSLNKNISHQHHERTNQLEHFQKRIIELELILSTLNSSNVVNETLLADIKQSNDIRYENEQLKKDIELLKSVDSSSLIFIEILLSD